MMLAPATIVWHPVIAPGGLAVLAVAGTALMVAGYLWVCRNARYRALLPALRGGALILIFVLLLQPARRQERVREEPPLLAVIVDVSASMTERLAPNPVSRAERAIEFLESETLQRAEKNFQLRVFTIGDRAESAALNGAALKFSSPESRLISGLNEIADRLRNENLAGVVLLTDGLDRSGGELGDSVWQIPFHIPSLEQPVPAETMPRIDWFIADVAHPERAIVGWNSTVEVMIRRTGEGDKAEMPVRFYRNAELVETRNVVFDPHTTYERVRFEITPEKVGVHHFTVVIEPKDDPRMDNNSREFMIEVIDDEMRILYLEGTPRWEFKFFKNALFRESQFSLDAFVQAANGVFLTFDEASGMSAGTNVSPDLSADALANYKVLVLGELTASALERNAAEIEAFVESGGGLLMLGGAKSFSADGAAHQPIVQRLLPAIPSTEGTMLDARFQLNITPEGHQHPALSGLAEIVAIPPVLSLWKPTRLHPLATSLLAAPDGSPVVAVRRYGRGRTAMILTDSLWRWRMAGRALADPGVQAPLYDRFHSQLIHWLAPSGKDLRGDAGFEMIVSGREFNLREPVEIGAVTGRAEDELQKLQCRVEGPDGTRVFTMAPTTLGVELGIGSPVPGFAFTFRADTPGRYMATATLPDGSDGDKVEFLVIPPRDELTGAPSNRDWLGELAQRSNGRFAPLAEWHRVLDGIQGRPRQVKVVEETPAWNHAVLFLLVAALLTTEWFLRRRAHLI